MGMSLVLQLFSHKPKYWTHYLMVALDGNLRGSELLWHHLGTMNVCTKFTTIQLDVEIFQSGPTCGLIDQRFHKHFWIKHRNNKNLRKSCINGEVTQKLREVGEHLSTTCEQRSVCQVFCFWSWRLCLNSLLTSFVISRLSVITDLFYW